MITDRINDNLSALFETDNDDIYKGLISDKNGTIPGTITLPTDIDIGALASQIEYLRKLSIGLGKQIYIDQASTEFLTYILNDFFDSLNLGSETDQQWISRTIAQVLSPKVSTAAIIYALRPYSPDGEPEIETVYTSDAYSEFSYADIYETDEAQGVLPAISEDYDNNYFTRKVILFGTSESDYFIANELLSILFAAGIVYILEIQ